MILPFVAQVIGDFVFPIPSDNYQIFWALMGAQFGGSFGSELDYGIQESEWFKKQNPWVQGFIKRALDFLHHWWMGAFLWLYAVNVASFIGSQTLKIPIMFFGFGLMVDDLRDIENLKRRYKVGVDDGTQ